MDWDSMTPRERELYAGAAVVLVLSTLVLVAELENQKEHWEIKP
jgi:type II secretory pathway component PulM